MPIMPFWGGSGGPEDDFFLVREGSPNGKGQCLGRGIGQRNVTEIIWHCGVDVASCSVPAAE